MAAIVHISRRVSRQHCLSQLIIVWSYYVIAADAACPVDWVTASSGCHKALSTATQFIDVGEARSLCQTEGADLAIVTDFAEQTLITNHLITLTGSYNYAYIGAMDTTGTGAHTWLDNQSAVIYSNFSAQYDSTNIRHQADRCVALHSPDGSWVADTVEWDRVTCCFKNNVFVAVCTKPDTTNVTIATDEVESYCQGNCPTGSRKLYSNCYKVKDVATPLNATYWARRACLDDGYDIADVPTGRVFDHVTHILTDRALTTYLVVHVGLNNLTISNEFVYTDGNTYTDRPPDVATCSYNSGTQRCMSMQSSSSIWDNNTTTYCPKDCCTDHGIKRIVCQRPMAAPVGSLAPDNDPFGEACYDGIDDCISNPCMNGGTCSDQILSYNCSCAATYTGVSCETEIDVCYPNPCMYNQNCTASAGLYACSCDPAYSGANCETVIDQCVSDPCQNSATCVDGNEMYTCICVPGFTGVNCETNVDECVGMSCQNNGTCDDRINEAVCLCPLKYSGDQCQTLIQCIPSDPRVGNSTSTRIGTNEAGDTMSFVCVPGLMMPDRSANRTLTCDPDTGNWDYPYAQLGNCEWHCPPLPQVANAEVQNPNTQMGSQVNFTCNIGYLFPDNSTRTNITCTQEGNWTLGQGEISDCEIIHCSTLPDYPYQSRDTNNDTYDTTVVFWCDVGHELHDHTTARTIRCKADGEWTAPLPPCQSVLCPKITIPSSWNLLRDSDNNTYGTYVNYVCADDKRMLDGATFRQIKCDATGEWSDDITNCTSGRCFPLPFVANATPSTLDTDFGTESMLICDKGHRFDERYQQRRMTCDTDGWWHPILSACEPIYCPVLIDVLNTEKSTDATLFATIVDYMCIKGHYYYPNMTTVVSTECLDSEQWNDTDIDECWPIVCDAPPTIVNGSRELPANNNFNYSSLVTYECVEGFKFIDGSNQSGIVCNEFGQWNQTDVSCRVDRCSPVPTADNVTPDTTNTSWYTNVTYACNIGHEWPDNKTEHEIGCQNDGNWNDTDIPPCTIKVCDPVPPMANATTNTSVHVYNTFVEYKCDIGHKIDNDTTSGIRWCSDMAKWQPPVFPDCQIVHCPELFDVENATRNSNDTHYNNHVLFECMSGYQFPDKAKVKVVYCTENETWSEMLPPCEVVFCPPVPWWTDTVFNSTSNEFNAEVSYWCDDGFVFEDSVNNPGTVKSSTCTQAKIWDPPIEDCVAKDSINADLIGVTYESPDSVSIGTIACALTVTVLCCMVLLDTHKIYSDLRIMKSNVSSFMKARKGRNRVSDSCTSIKNAVDSTAA